MRKDPEQGGKDVGQEVGQMERDAKVIQEPERGGGEFSYPKGVEGKESHDRKQCAAKTHGDDGPSVAFVPMGVDDNVDGDEGGGDSAGSRSGGGEADARSEANDGGGEVGGWEEETTG